MKRQLTFIYVLLYVIGISLAIYGFYATAEWYKWVCFAGIFSWIIIGVNKLYGD